MKQTSDKLPQMINLRTATRFLSGVVNKNEIWLSHEHFRFVGACLIHGCDWIKISKLIPTKSAIQIRVHARKYLLKLKRKYRHHSINPWKCANSNEMIRQLRLLIKDPSVLEHEITTLNRLADDREMNEFLNSKTRRNEYDIIDSELTSDQIEYIEVCIISKLKNSVERQKNLMLLKQTNRAFNQVISYEEDNRMDKAQSLQLLYSINQSVVEPNQDLMYQMISELGNNAGEPSFFQNKSTNFVNKIISQGFSQLESVISMGHESLFSTYMQFIQSLPESNEILSLLIKKSQNEEAFEDNQIFEDLENEFVKYLTDQIPCTNQESQDIELNPMNDFNFMEALNQQTQPQVQPEDNNDTQNMLQQLFSVDEASNELMENMANLLLSNPQGNNFLELFNFK